MAKLSGKTKKSLSSKMPLRQINREPEKANSQENADDAIGKAIAIASAKKPDKKFLPVSKEIFDRIGYGFGSQQFVSILFFLTGASFFVIGAINGARVVLSTLVSLLLQQYAKIKSVRRIVSASGIIFGFSFLLISTAVFLHSVALFSLAVLLGGASIVPYSDLYQKLVREKDKTYLRRIVNYGLIITAIILFVSAFLSNLAYSENYSPLGFTATLLHSRQQRFPLYFQAISCPLLMLRMNQKAAALSSLSGNHGVN